MTKAKKSKKPKVQPVTDVKEKLKVIYSVSSAAGELQAERLYDLETPLGDKKVDDLLPGVAQALLTEKLHASDKTVMRVAEGDTVKVSVEKLELVVE